MSLSPGTRLGPYELIVQIGAGGMGEVYRARDTRLDRTIAIKVLSPEVAGDTDLRSRFEREARAVAALDHPHICGIYDVGSVDGAHYLVMPHLDGQTLAARLEGGPLPLDQALKITAEIADALDKAHRQGITHRDLKPANIMLTNTGSKLLDFGLAKLRVPAVQIATSAPTTLATTTPGTAHGRLLGTVPYMAPEQVEGQEADARSDIWALGVVIYEMVTGTRPFQGNTPVSVIGAILKDDPPPISRVRPRTPTLLDQIVARCLAKDADDRWQSARDLQTVLGWTGESTQTTSRRSASGAQWAGIVVALLACGGVLGWFGASWRAPVTDPRALSLQIDPPPGGEFVLSAIDGGSAISPDGRTIAFVAKVNGVSRLWVRPLDSSVAAQELRDTDDASLPFWSQDSKSLGFFANGSLRKIEATGGASTMLTPVSNPRGGSWNADGTIAFAESIGPLQRISASGGTPSPLTILAATEQSHRWPRFLPDGRILLFFVQGDRPGVYVTSLDGKGEKRRIVDASLDAAYVPPGDAEPGSVLMVRGDSLAAQPFDIDSMRVGGPPIDIPGAGKALAFVGANRSNLSVANDRTIVYAAGSNQYQLTWFGADGTPLRNIGGPDRYVGLQISPNGTEALTVVDDAVGNRDIWRMHLTSGIRNRVTSDNRGGWGTWSRDDQAIAFSGSTRQTVFEKKTNGDSGDRVLLKSEYPTYPADWSRDGKYLLYVQDSPGKRFDVWALSTEGAANATPLLQTPAGEWHPQFSPDGEFIAYTSDESGRTEVFTQKFTDATKRRKVSTDGGGYPRWSRKGNELFFRSLDGQLMAVPVQFNEISVVLGPARQVGMRLIEPPGLLTYPYDIASDGRILALAPTAGEDAHISLTVLVNWHAPLRR